MEKVIFKLIDNSVIALFPDLVWDSKGSIASYMHIGQHGGANPQLIKDYPDASIEQFQDLKNELINIGYELDIKYPLPF